MKCSKLGLDSRQALTLMLILCTLILNLSARASIRTVTSLADDGTAGTLRSQITAAASGDTIDFSVAGTIQLVGSTPLRIAKDLSIVGPGAGSLNVKAANGYAVGIFDITNNIVSISGLKLSDGNGKGIWTYNSGTGMYGWQYFGGAIYINGGTVTLMDSILSGNTAKEGGAIYLENGSLEVKGSTITNNLIGTSGYAGGIQVRNSSLLVENSTISGNTAGWGGGIIINSGTAHFANSTISGNTAKHYWQQDPIRPSISYSVNGRGGGIFIAPDCTVTITNCTISGNVAEGTDVISGCTSNCPSPAGYLGGGGILNAGTLTVAHSTIAQNSAAAGAGINTSYGTLQMSHSIVASNTTNRDLKGLGISGDYNLVQSGDTVTGANNIFGQPAVLGPLANNGGPTRTHALLLGSPAIDAGDPNFDTTNMPYDQRGPGFARIINGRICIGAAESEQHQVGSNFVVNTLDDHEDGIASLSDCTLREAIKYAPAGSTITFDVAGTITLTGGELLITNSLTIAGPTNGLGITVSGNNTSRLFSISNGIVNLSTLTLSGGNGAGSVNAGIGGAMNIFGGVVTLTDTTFSSNTATNGGAIRNGGTLLIQNSTFSGNSGLFGGGAIQNNGTATLVNSTFSGNNSPSVGGAIRCSAGNLTILSSTFFGNTALTNCGGIAITGTGTLTLSNSIVAGNTAPTNADISGTVAFGDYNLVQTRDPSTLPGSHNITGQPALLGSLTNNGGPTMTHALLPGSPALDAGDTSLTEDQRGVSRPQGTGADIGAFEWQQHRPMLSIQESALTQVEICWDTVPNTWYQLQGRSILTDPWTPLTAWVGGNGQPMCANDSVLIAGPQRFYQVGVTNSP